MVCHASKSHPPISIKQRPSYPKTKDVKEKSPDSPSWKERIIFQERKIQTTFGSSIYIFPSPRSQIRTKLHSPGRIHWNSRKTTDPCHTDISLLWCIGLFLYFYLSLSFCLGGFCRFEYDHGRKTECLCPAGLRIRASPSARWIFPR